MTDRLETTERYLYQAGGKWVFGPDGGTKIIRHMRGFEAIAQGIRHPNQCILKSLMGVDNNAYIPSFSGEKTLDDQAKLEIQRLQISYMKDIKAAKKEGFLDEAKAYESELKELQKALKRDFITARIVKRMYGGEILIAFTNRVRQQKLRVVQRLRKEGFSDEAADLNDIFVVSDRSIFLFKDQSDYKWLLKPPE